MKRKGERDIYDVDLFSAEIVEPECPLPSTPRRPPPNVPLSRAVRDAVEDVLEANAPEGVSWAWSVERFEYVAARVLFVLSDCAIAGGITVGVLLSDDVERDRRNVLQRIEAIRMERKRRAAGTRREVRRAG